MSNKYLLFSWAKTLKLPKEGKKLQWSKSSQIAVLFGGFDFFPVRGDTPRSDHQILYLSVWYFHHNRTNCRDHTKIYKQHQI